MLVMNIGTLQGYKILALKFFLAQFVTNLKYKKQNSFFSKTYFQNIKVIK